MLLMILLLLILLPLLSLMMLWLFVVSGIFTRMCKKLFSLRRGRAFRSEFPHPWCGRVEHVNSRDVLDVHDRDPTRCVAKQRPLGQLGEGHCGGGAHCIGGLAYPSWKHASSHLWLGMGQRTLVAKRVVSVAIAKLRFVVCVLVQGWDLSSGIVLRSGALP